MKISVQRWKSRLDSAINILPQKGITIQQGCTYNDLLKQVQSSNFLINEEKVAFARLFANGLANTGERYDSDGDAMGKIDYEYIRNHFPNEVILKLAEPIDYATLYEQELEQNRIKRNARKKRNVRYSILFTVLLVIGIIVYNLPYFAEKRAYSRTVDNPNIEAFDKYIEKYPEHEHLPDVLFRRALFHLHDANMYSYDKAASRQCVELLDSFIIKFPNHELSQKAEVTIDSIWDSEISRFTEKNPNYASSNSLKAMYEMLNYMKSNKVYDIKLNVISDVNLKEYSEFPTRVRDLMEYYYPELKSNPVLKIKDYFGTPDQENLEEMLISEFTKSINKLFTPNFFSVIINHDENQDDKHPIIDLGYSIKSQTINVDGVEMPNIWTYSSKSSYGIKSMSYEKNIMGIEVSFESSLNFPGLKTPWEIKVKGAPEEDINDIDGISNGYRVMTRKCFERFGSQLYSLLGISNTEQ